MIPDRKPREPAAVKADATVSSAWTSVLEKVRRAPTPHLLLSFDPGETTGWAYFVDGELRMRGQHATSYEWLSSVFQTLKPTAVVCENYKVYASRAKQHVGSEVLTVRYIGAIELICQTMGVPLTMQMAFQAKGFCTDKKLKLWGMYQVALPHANDAIRHAVYYLLFHSDTKSSTGKGLHGTQSRRQGSSL